MSVTGVKIKGWLGLLGIFAAGILLGATLMVICNPQRCSGPKSPPKPEQIAEKLSRELNLSGAQKERILAILQVTGQQFRGLSDQKRKERMMIFNKSCQQIRVELNPEQQTKYDEMMLRLSERWERERKENRD